MGRTQQVAHPGVRLRSPRHAGTDGLAAGRGGPVQPAIYGSNRKRQGLGGQLLALALQVAKDDQDAEVLGQAIDFFVEDRAWLVTLGRLEQGGSLLGLAIWRRRAAAYASGHSLGHAVQPGPERVMNPELA